MLCNTTLFTLGQGTTTVLYNTTFFTLAVAATTQACYTTFFTLAKVTIALLCSTTLFTLAEGTASLLCNTSLFTLTVGISTVPHSTKLSTLAQGTSTDLEYIIVHWLWEPSLCSLILLYLHTLVTIPLVSSVTVLSLTSGSTTLPCWLWKPPSYTTVHTVTGNHEPAVTTVSRMALRTTPFSVIDNNESVLGVKMAKA
jgi:hypothetical protein